MPLAIGFFILLMITSLIVLYKDCDFFAEYLFSTVLGVMLSALITFLFAIIICGIEADQSYIKNTDVIDLE